MQVSKADWKLFRERVGGWQEHYMEGLLKQYVELLTTPGQASAHFWELEKRIRKDKRHPGVLLALNKSQTVWDIARFVQEGIITTDDLEGFSTELIDAVKEIVNRWNTEVDDE